jgi:hypothetical protein
MKKEKCVAIICRYLEDLEWTKQLKIPMYIANKGDSIDFPNHDVKAIMRKYENVGRESESFLRFIIENYNDLPQRMVFLQGDPDSHFRGLHQFLTKPNKNEICFLADFNPVCDAIGRPHHFEELPLKEILRELQMDYSMDSFHFAAGAQYLVPRKYILNKSLKWWKNAYEVHKNNKTAPWSFERLWPLIWKHEERL